MWICIVQAAVDDLKHRETAAKYGVALDDSHRQAIYHNNGQQNWEWMRKDFGLDIPLERYLEEIDAWYADHVVNVRFRPGIAEALDLFSAAGCRQCVVSNGRRNSVMLALNARNIVPRFDFILCKEDYEGRKPDPSPYLTALQKMENSINTTIDLADCLAIEDDPLGVTSAHSAGIKVIHRRLNDSDPSAPEADVSVFSEDDFLNACKKFIS